MGRFPTHSSFIYLSAWRLLQNLYFLQDDLMMILLAPLLPLQVRSEGDRLSRRGFVFLRTEVIVLDDRFVLRAGLFLSRAVADEWTRAVTALNYFY